MRLHRLEVTGVGPFRSTQVIDFDELSSSGLFLIEGPTGSGKTTIIDAIVYALFGVVSAGTDDVTRMRIPSHYCLESDPVGVVCEFSVDGHRLRVVRIPAGCRDPREPDKPARSKGPRQVLVEVGHPEDAAPPPLTARKDVDDRIRELLGMTVDQFRQLVVLPQGQFADLLRQSPADRLKSLEPLLEDGRIAAVQADLAEQGRLAQERRARAAAETDRSAQQLEGRLTAWLAETSPEVGFTDATTPDADRLAVVDDLLAALARQSDRVAAARDEQAEVTATARSAARAAADAHAALVAVQSARAAVIAAAQDLDPADRDIADHAVGPRLAELQRLCGTLESLASWEAQADARAAERARLEQQARALRDERGERQEERAALPAHRTDLEARLAAVLEEAGGGDAARREEERISGLLDSAARLADEEARLAAATAEAELAEAAADDAGRRAVDARAHVQAVLERQHAQAAASLARTLAAGTACPVCGSTDHPAPASGADGESPVTPAELDAARREAEAADAAATAADVAARAAQARQAEAVAIVAGLAGALGGQDAESLAAELDRARDRRSRAEQAQESAGRLRDEIATLGERERALDTTVAELGADIAGIEATLAERLAAEAEQSARIAAVVGAAGSATALLSSTSARIAALSVLQECRSTLAGALAAVPAEHRESTVEGAADIAERSARAQHEAESLLERLTEEAATVASTLADARPLADAFRGAVAEQRRVHEATAPAIELGSLVTAGNAKRLQLRSYALQRRFASVLAAATGHLERMSAGRFSFELSEDTARAGQSGLGIALLDSWTGQAQDPKSLSGGETFYASLALALGLADVVRGEAGGSTLETLFVDEGFGSLDQDTLTSVLDQLDSLRAGNRVVGVVSHVTEMKEAIPHRLEVRRQPDSTSSVARASA